MTPAEHTAIIAVDGVRAPPGGGMVNVVRRHWLILIAALVGTACGPAEAVDAGADAAERDAEVDARDSGQFEAGHDVGLDGALDARDDSDAVASDAVAMETSVEDSMGAPADAADTAAPDASDARADTGCFVGYSYCPGATVDGVTTAPGCYRLNDDNYHCGACNMRCRLPNAYPRCVAGECTIAMCGATRYADCNRMAADGCEVDLYTNVLHCGMCGTVCPAGQRCMRGVCR